MTRVLAAGLLVAVIAAAVFVFRSRQPGSPAVAETGVRSATAGVRLQRVLTALGTIRGSEVDATAGVATGNGAAGHETPAPAPDDLDAEFVGASRPLLPGDRDLLEPDSHSEGGELAGADAGASSLDRHRFSIRLKHRTIAPGQPLEAVVDVSTPEGRSVTFRVRRVDTRDTDSGQIDPAGTWTAAQNERGQSIVWSPPPIPPDSGRRTLDVQIEVGGEVRSLSTTFAIGWPPPVRATDGVRVATDDAFLRVEVRFAAKATWSCQLSANLFDDAGRPLQHTSWMGTVTDGTWVPFEFARALLDGTDDDHRRLSLRDVAGTCRSAGDEGAVVARIETVATPYELVTRAPGSSG